MAKELDFATLVSFSGDRALLVLSSTAIGALLGLARFERLLVTAAVAGVSLWLLVAFTPLTRRMGEALVRSDPLQKADAVFVLASGLQADGELSTAAMSRLLGGLELLGEGWAPRLVLSELPLPSPRYSDAAREVMASLGMSQEVLVVGPVLNTHDEAVAVGKLAREVGIERLLVVTSPSHSLRASLALEAEGVEVVSIPSVETMFDYQNLGTIVHGDDRIRAFGVCIHEYAGLW
ncbi:MAG: YdcF family protein, partial [Vicinamibacteria bacterium]